MQRKLILHVPLQIAVAGAAAQFKFTLARPRLLLQQIQRQRRYFIPQVAVNYLNGLSVEQLGSDLMKNLIAGLLFLVCVTAHAANPSMAQLNFASNSLVAQISAGQVFSNTASSYVEANGGTNFYFYTTPGHNFPSFTVGDLSRGHISIVGNNGTGINGSTPTGQFAFDLYSYSPFVGSQTINSVFGMGADGGYIDGFSFDPGSDNSPEAPFMFSTTYSNTMAASANLFEVQNSHTNKFVITGEGGIQTPSLQSSSTNTTNATPLDVAQLLTAYQNIAVKTNVFPGAVASAGTFWASNYALYWVTPTKTNLITDGL